MPKKKSNKKSSSVKSTKTRRKSRSRVKSLSKSVSFVDDAVILDSPPPRIPEHSHECQKCSDNIICIGPCRALKTCVIKCKEEVFTPKNLYFCGRGCFLTYKPPTKGWFW